MNDIFLRHFIYFGQIHLATILSLETMIYNKECYVVAIKCAISFDLKFLIHVFFSARDDECILQLLGVACCDRKCIRKLSIEDVHSSELLFHNMDHAEKRNYIHGFLSENSNMGDSGD